MAMATIGGPRPNPWGAALGNAFGGKAQLDWQQKQWEQYVKAMQGQEASMGGAQQSNPQAVYGAPGQQGPQQQGGGMLGGIGRRLGGMFGGPQGNALAGNPFASMFGSGQQQQPAAMGQPQMPQQAGQQGGLAAQRLAQARQLNQGMGRPLGAAAMAPGLAGIGGIPGMPNPMMLMMLQQIMQERPRNPFAR